MCICFFFFFPKCKFNSLAAVDCWDPPGPGASVPTGWRRGGGGGGGGGGADAIKDPGADKFEGVYGKKQ